jgi:hypothetical protein
MVATGCDKAKAFLQAGQAAGPPRIPPGEEMNLASHPVILFQIFGETGDARMVPVATISGGKLKAIQLTAENWQKFDAEYLRHGKSYTIYQDGHTSGTAEVRQGMWERTGNPLYTLPGCHTLTPLAAVRANALRVRNDFTLEMLASNGTLGVSRAPQPMAPAEIARIARGVAVEVAQAAGIKPQVLDSLDFHAVSFPSGATKSNTIVASFIDPSAEKSSSTGARTTHILLVADKDSAGAWRASFAHRINGPLAAAAFRRYFDHLDLTGDGVDEIILEGWTYGGDTFLTVLGWKNGKWSEVYRARSNWCLDERPTAEGAPVPAPAPKGAAGH